MLVEAQPMTQTLQAPLWLMSGPGKVLSLSSLSAVCNAGFNKLQQQLSLNDATNRIIDIGNDVSLASKTAQCLDALIGTLPRPHSSPS
jgi:hypothetical protein